MSKHTLTADLIYLRSVARTKFEHELVSVLGKQYGLITALQLQMRLTFAAEDVAPSKTLPQPK